MFEKILVCLDGSSLAEQILPYAIEQALHFHSKIVLLRVIRVPGSALPGEPELVEKEDESVTAEEDEVVTYLDNVTNALVEKGLDVEGVIISAHKPDIAIITYARENDMDIIALATRGDGVIGQMLWGSVSGSVLRKSGLPMLIIKAGESNQPPFKATIGIKT
jgi:nucleotide-binding universal stress UspA family protein